MKRIFLCLLLCTQIALTAKPLLVVTRPKAGTTYIRHCLHTYFGGLVPKEEFVFPRPTAEQFRALAKKYAEKDIPIVHHFGYIQEDLIEAVRDCGCKIVFVYRDPRAVITSVAIWEVVLHRKFSFDPNPDLEAQESGIRAKIRSLFPQMMSKNLRILAEYRHWYRKYPGLISILPHQLLRENRDQFFMEILKHFEQPQKSIDLTRIPPPIPGTNNIRNSQPDDWKRFMDSDLRARAQQMIPQEIKEFYGFEN